MSESKMRTIQKLLDTAEHPETAPEMAKTYREKAERLMAQYAIQEAELAHLRLAEGADDKPDQRYIQFGEEGNPVLTQYYNLFIALAEHHRCKFFGFSTGLGIMVGYPSDMDFVEMLYASVRLQMMNKVEPKPDPYESYDSNVNRLHDLGVKWRNIAHLMNEWQVEGGWDQTPWPDGGRLIRACKRYCKENGLTYRPIQSPDKQLRSYASGFLDTVRMRLREMRAHRDDEMNNASGGAQLVLVSRKDRVKSMFDDVAETHGHKDRRYRTKIDAAQYYRGSQDGKSADLSGGRNNVANRKGLEG